jgi:hypothetical protein
MLVSDLAELLAAAREEGKDAVISALRFMQTKAETMEVEINTIFAQQFSELDPGQVVTMTHGYILGVQHAAEIGRQLGLVFNTEQTAALLNDQFRAAA